MAFRLATSRAVVRTPSVGLRCSTTTIRATKTRSRPYSTPPQPKQGAEKPWLSRKVEQSPAATAFFLKLANVLGYNSPQQVAGRRSFILYEGVCARAPDLDKSYWQNECFLPPTFQSWFTITNLHVWMLTVRLRALPEPHGRAYIQSLLDHFFIDVEDRIRFILQPPASLAHSTTTTSTTADPTSTPSKSGPPVYTFHTDFYTNPNAQHAGKKGSKAPDRIVNRQMKIFKEQWAGMGISFDLGLVQGDEQLAGAIWRNLLGARGAQGIVFDTDQDTKTTYRRAVNLVGGEVVNVSKIDMDKEATTDDGSGVHDFPPAEVDNYLLYPDRMLELVGYCRREIARLAEVSDADIMSGDWEKLKFGRVVSQK